MVRYEGVYHGRHGHAREEEGRDEGGPVAKVEHAHGQRAEDDGEVQPREEGPLVGEEDLGLDARGERNALAYGERWVISATICGLAGWARTNPGRFEAKAGSTLCEYFSGRLVLRRRSRQVVTSRSSSVVDRSLRNGDDRDGC